MCRIINDNFFTEKVKSDILRIEDIYYKVRKKISRSIHRIKLIRLYIIYLLKILI